MFPEGENIKCLKCLVGVGIQNGADPRETRESTLSSHINSHLLRAKCVQLLETKEAGLEQYISNDLNL